MVVKIDKISDTEYVKYSNCSDAYYAEIKYDRDKSSFAGIAYKITDDKSGSSGVMVGKKHPQPQCLC